MLAAVLRFGSGPAALGWDNFVCGILPVLFIIHPPQAIDREVVAGEVAVGRVVAGRGRSIPTTADKWVCRGGCATGRHHQRPESPSTAE